MWKQSIKIDKCLNSLKCNSRLTGKAIQSSWSYTRFLFDVGIKQNIAVFWWRVMGSLMVRASLGPGKAGKLCWLVVQGGERQGGQGKLGHYGGWRESQAGDRCMVSSSFSARNSRKPGAACFWMSGLESFLRKKCRVGLGNTVEIVKDVLFRPRGQRKRGAQEAGRSNSREKGGRQVEVRASIRPRQASQARKPTKGEMRTILHGCVKSWARCFISIVSVALTRFLGLKYYPYPVSQMAKQKLNPGKGLLTIHLFIPGTNVYWAATLYKAWCRTWRVSVHSPLSLTKHLQEKNFAWVSSEPWEGGRVYDPYFTNENIRLQLRLQVRLSQPGHY